MSRTYDENLIPLDRLFEGKAKSFRNGNDEEYDADRDDSRNEMNDYEDE